MGITFDNIIFILGIIIGVGLTLLGVSFTEYLKNKTEKKRLTTYYHWIINQLERITVNQLIR